MRALAFVILFAIAGFELVADQMHVTASSLYVRERPSSKAPVVTALPIGTTVDLGPPEQGETIAGKKGSWRFCKACAGYVFDAFLSPKPPRVPASARFSLFSRTTGYETSLDAQLFLFSNRFVLIRTGSIYFPSLEIWAGTYSIEGASLLLSPSAAKLYYYRNVKPAPDVPRLSDVPAESVTLTFRAALNGFATSDIVPLLQSPVFKQDPSTCQFFHPAPSNIDEMRKPGYFCPSNKSAVDLLKEAAGAPPEFLKLTE